MRSGVKAVPSVEGMIEAPRRQAGLLHRVCFRA